MPNDAKLGLFLGISLVVVIGMVFFRVDPPASGANPPTTSVNSAAVLPAQKPPALDPLVN